MKRAFLFILFCTFCAFPMMAYESPITEPGAGNVGNMYTTAGSGPHKMGMNTDTGEETYNPEDWGGGSGSDAGDWDEKNSPVGAPWILLGFAAAYAGVRLVKRSRGAEE